MSHTGSLYIVATPIGNLNDISKRAILTLESVDCIAAEDTRHSQALLKHLGINKPLLSYHDHNEAKTSDQLLQQLNQGQSIALITDAGTPLISDPGHLLVKKAHAAGIRVIPIPGACAAMAALSASGFSADSFFFYGFLPAKTNQRIKALQSLTQQPGEIIFYEAPHRILESLQNLCEVFGAERRVCFARELTKQFETLRVDTLQHILEWVQRDPNQQRGEIVLVLESQTEKEKPQDLSTEQTLLLKRLLAELHTKTAASIMADFTGLDKQQLYRLALELKNK